jgi:hypothetical protein
METKKFDMFYPTINRILMLLLSWYYQWLCVLKPKKIQSDNPKPDYSQKYLLQFKEFSSQPSEIKNANIDSIIKNNEALSELISDENNELEKQWKSRILIENTPRGNVFMFYNIYKNCFSYYCDQAVMPYQTLNAVAMKYVMTFKCCDFFVDSQIIGTKNIPAKEPVESLPKNSAFAKFKTYNVASKKAEVKKEDEKVINGFLHLGQVRNLCIINKPKRVNPLNGFKTDLVPSGKVKLSYDDYKKSKNMRK